MTHVDCNANKYSFFIRTVLMLNLLPNEVITARNTKLFNENF